MIYEYFRFPQEKEGRQKPAIATVLKIMRDLASAEVSFLFEPSDSD